jgi:hypothetical protein
MKLEGSSRETLLAVLTLELGVVCISQNVIHAMRFTKYKRKQNLCGHSAHQAYHITYLHSRCPRQAGAGAGGHWAVQTLHAHQATSFLLEAGALIFSRYTRETDEDTLRRSWPTVRSMPTTKFSHLDRN